MSPPREHQEPSHSEVDDEMTQAVVEVARELDAKRTWKKRLRDAIAGARLVVALVRHRRRRG